jgi:hypothetical protein
VIDRADRSAGSPANGGRDHGPRGLHPRDAADHGAAFVFASAGHNIEAVCRASGAPADRKNS